MPKLTRSRNNRAARMIPRLWSGWGLLVLAFWSPAFAQIPNPSTNGLPPRSLPTGPGLSTTIPWVQTNLVIGHLPPADPRQIDAFLAGGYQVLTVNTLLQWDRVGPGSADYSPNIVSNATDYLARFVSTTHSNRAKAVFYFGPVQSPLWSPQFRANHPGWLRVKPDGTTDPNYVNFRDPGLVNWLTNQLVYLASSFAVDGFWFDGYSPEALHTYDAATRSAFKAYSGGTDIPVNIGTNSISQLYLNWHYAYFADLLDRIKQAVRAVRPDCVIYGNYSANRTWYPTGWSRGEYPAYYSGTLDLPSVELYWDNPGDALYQQFVYAFTQGTAHDRGARAWVQPHAHGTLGTPPPLEILLRCLAGAPWGVYAEFVENAEREEYYQLYQTEAVKRQEWWKSSTAVPWIGIVASEQTRLLMGNDTFLKYFSHTLGAFKAVFEAHLPVRILSEYDLENADLQGITVLILPDVRVLSDRSSEVIRRFVSSGAGLIASRAPGLYDQNLQRRATFSLGDVLHADYVGNYEVTTREPALSLWLQATNHPIVNDPNILGQQKTAWRVSSGFPPAQGWLDLVASTTFASGRPGGQIIALVGTNENLASATPAIITSTYGQGRVVYMAAALDQGLFFYPNTYIRSLLVNACKWVAQTNQPPVEIDGPLVLAATSRRQQNRTLVHLLNDQSSYGRHSIFQKLSLPGNALFGPWPVREELIPLYDIKVRCRAAGITKATQQPENLDLPLTTLTGGGVEVLVPELDLYSIVVFE